MNREIQGKVNNVICSLLVVLGVYAIGAYFFDFYYDINDDLLIKDILSGAYSGTPNGYTNQMLYPIGFFISVVYRILPKAPVFGLFLCLCFAVCFWMISFRMQSFYKNIKVKIVAVAVIVMI